VDPAARFHFKARQSPVLDASDWNAQREGRTQRAFQASARVITASDTLLGDLINIIR